MFHTIYIFLTMFLIPTIFYLVDKKKNGVTGTESLRWYIFFVIGVRAFTTGAMQFLNSSYTMELLSVGEDSRIIIAELGFAQFAIGLIALISIRKKSFRVPSLITYGIFMLGASIIHIMRFEVANLEEIVSLAGDIFVLVIALDYTLRYFLQDRKKLHESANE